MPSGPSHDTKMLIGFAGVFLAQTIAGLLWAGAAAERLSQLEYKVDQTQHLIERTARLEEQTTHIRQTLSRIERKIDAGQVTP